MSVEGYCAQRFKPLRDLFAAHLKSGQDLGASICVSVHGETAVDLWGGYTTPARTTPWTKDTITPVFSISKTITALATFLLIDRGQLHPDDPVSKYWPAFNTPDKQGVKVKHFLAHTAGLPSWHPPISVSELFDIPTATQKLVAQEPWWEPGTASGYHLISQGLLLGELIQRVSGKSLQEFVKEEIALPLNADFHLGLDENEWTRLADMKPPQGSPMSADTFKNLPAESVQLALRALRGCPIQASHSSTPEFRRSGIGSVAGLSNARGFNRILELVTHRGSINGVQFLKPSTIDLIFESQASGTDLVIGVPLNMGMGFGLSSGIGRIPWMPEGKVCFWGGLGGSIAVMDLERGVTVTYAMNRMEEGTLGNSNSMDYVRAVYEVLEPRVYSSL